MTSLSDVAALAGVSLSTASRVMSPSTHPVSEGTRRRVLEAARVLDYEHNMLARGLAVRRTKTVGVIVHDILDEYFALVARGIEDAAYADGYTTFVCNSDRDPDREITYVRKLRATRVDALIFAAGGIIDREYEKLLAAQVRQIERAGGVVVWLAPQPKRRPTIYYSTDQGMRQIAEHLRALGHRRVLYADGPDHIATTPLRAAAFRAAGEQHGLDVALLGGGDFSRASGLRRTREVVDHIGRGVTAVVGANYQIALGLLDGLQQAGVRIPQDVSLCGFGDVSACSDVRPALTTVRLPLYQLGVEGMRFAKRALAGERPRRRRPFPTELVIRSSTAAAPG